MVLKYNSDNHISGLNAILDDYTEWFVLVIRHVSYPQMFKGQPQPVKPRSFTAWIEEAKHQDMVGKLTSLYADLSRQANKILENSAARQNAVEFKDFDSFVTLFEEFIRHLRRLEIDVLLEDSGIDSLTGLRSEATLINDLKCEMDRLARQGKPFCLALVRIDRFEEIKKTGDVDAVLKGVAEMILRSLRSFDDAYRHSEGSFLLSLKQTDISGGVKALERLKKELLSRQRESISVGLSLSSCIAEPLPSDDVEMLIHNLNMDLVSSDRLDAGSVLEYFEVSPLERYVEDSKK